MKYLIWIGLVHKSLSAQFEKLACQAGKLVLLETCSNWDFVRHSKGEDQALLDTHSGNHDFLVSAPCLVYNNLQNEKSILMPMSMVTAQSQISLVGIIYKLCKQSSALSSSWYKTVYIGSKTLDTFSSMVKLLFLQMKHENKRRRGEKKGT